MSKFVHWNEVYVLQPGLQIAELWDSGVWEGNYHLQVWVVCAKVVTQYGMLSVRPFEAWD